MRFLILSLIVFASCKSTVTKEKLLGSWTTEQEDTKYLKNGVFDKMTFFENDSFKVEMYLNEKLHESFSGKYTLDEQEKLITSTIGSIESQAEIIELTSDRLTIKQDRINTISKFRRL